MPRLDRLFRPRSVAVIGGGRWGANVIAECRRIGFDGPIWPVHPGRKRMQGIASVPTIADLPEPPDAAFVGVNRHSTVEVVRALAARGAGGAVCFASGFREARAELADGADLQADLIAAAGDMPILGPNCYGLVNALDGVALWPDMHGMVPCDRGVAIVTQSSNLSINLTMDPGGLPIAYMVTSGNQAQTSMAEIGRALLDDPRVTVLGLHIEGVGDLSDFIALARHARALGKPVVTLKVGASEQAQSAMVSHTASLAGSDAGARALLRRLGFGQCATPAIFLETLKLLHLTGTLPSTRIASLSCSGGEASLMADMGAAAGLTYPPLEASQLDGLRAALGPKVALANPLDYHTYIWGDTAAMAATFQAMMQGDLALGIVVLDYPRPDRFKAPEWDQVIDAMAQVEGTAPLAVLATLSGNLPEPVAQSAMARGVVPLAGAAEGLAAVAIAAQMHPQHKIDVLLPGAPDRMRNWTEAESKSVLAQAGVPVPRATITDRDDAPRAAAEIGFPVAVKGQGIAHKTEAGAVALNLTTPQAVVQAAQTMPGTQVLVEEQVTGGVAELLIGVLRDPAHGFILTLGAGGTLTELISDTTSVLVPAPRHEVEQALQSLRMAPLLYGYRGAPPANIDAILDVVEAVQRFVAAHADRLNELEINPLICNADSAIAVDALLRMGDPP